jgi:hypothetical protein
MKSKDARSHSEELGFKDYKKVGNTGVSRYSVLEDGIVLIFRDKPDYYLYSFKKPGSHVKEMIEAATKGEKLSAYVNQNVRDNYDDTWPPADSVGYSSPRAVKPTSPSKKAHSTTS